MGRSGTLGPGSVEQGWALGLWKKWAEPGSEEEVEEEVTEALQFLRRGRFGARRERKSRNENGQLEGLRSGTAVEEDAHSEERRAVSLRGARG